MTLIDALRHGASVRRLGETEWLDHNAIIEFMAQCIPTVDLLADDWEVDKVEAKKAIQDAVAKRIEELRKLKKGG